MNVLRIPTTTLVLQGLIVIDLWGALHSSYSIRSFFSSNSKLIQHPLLVAFLLLWWFLMHFSFETHARWSYGCSPPDWCKFLFKSYTELMQILSRATSSSSAHPFIQFLCEIDEIPLCRFHPSPVQIYYSVPIKSWWISSLSQPSSGMPALAFCWEVGLQGDWGTIDFLPPDLPF